MKLRISVGAFLALSFISATAQTLLPAEAVTYQPTIGRDEKGVKSCGLRLIVAVLSKDNESTAYDFSVNLWSSANGLLKAGSHTMSFTKARGWDYRNMVIRRPGPESFWLAKRDENIALRPAKFIKADDAGYVLGGADGMETMKIMYSMLSGDSMQVSLHYASDRLDKVISFNNNMSEDDKATVSGCLSSLAERMDKYGPAK